MIYTIFNQLLENHEFIKILNNNKNKNIIK